MSNQSSYQVFKHLPREFVDRLFDTGEVRVGNFKSYRNIENDSLRDEQEGYKFASWSAGPGKTLIKVEGRDVDYRELRPDEKPGIVFGEMSFARPVVYADAYIYCASTKSDPEMFDGCDSCFEIVDCEGFMMGIAKALQTKNLIACGAIHMMPMTYVDGRWLDRRNKLAAYWVKDKRFETDCEVRTVFPPIFDNPDDRHEPVTLLIPGIRQYCKRLY